MTVRLRRAAPADAAAITAMIHDLAEFERAPNNAASSRHRSAQHFSQLARRCAHMSPRWTAKSPRWHCGFSTSRPGTASTASTWKTCSYDRLSPSRPGPGPAVRAGQRVCQQRIHPAVLGGTGLEHRCDRAVRIGRRSGRRASGRPTWCPAPSWPRLVGPHDPGPATQLDAAWAEQQRQPGRAQRGRPGYRSPPDASPSSGSRPRPAATARRTPPNRGPSAVRPAATSRPPTPRRRPARTTPTVPEHVDYRADPRRRSPGSAEPRRPPGPSRLEQRRSIPHHARWPEYAWR